MTFDLNCALELLAGGHEARLPTAVLTMFSNRKLYLEHTLYSS